MVAGTETVTLHHASSWDGHTYDDDGQPVYVPVQEDVSGVLVAPGDPSEVGVAERPDGRYVTYTVYLPKSYTGSVEDVTQVAVRGGDPLPVYGHPARYDHGLCPTDWDCAMRLMGSEG